MGDHHHRLLVLFVRADQERAGALPRSWVKELSFMPLGGVSEALKALLSLRSTDSLSPAQWLAVVDSAVTTPEAVEEFLESAESLDESFPALNPTVEELLSSCNEMAKAGGERGLHTLAVAAAQGSAAVVKHVVEVAPPWKLDLFRAHPPSWPKL
jgi:hypothetical protein